MSGRCQVVVLPDGSRVRVRLAKRGAKLTERDLAAIQEIRDAVIRQRYRGGDPECNHEDDGEGCCLGCGAELSR